MNSRVQHYGLATLCALALVGSIDLLGNSLDRAAHDGRFYVDMARNGVLGNAQLAAPFAYRPAVPMAVRALSQTTDVSVLTGFQVFARIGALASLLAAFAIARATGASLRLSLLVMSATSLSYFHVKFPLFFFPLVDVEAMPLMALALWAALARRFGVCLALGCCGLFFKEFLAIPLVLMLGVLARDFGADRSRRDLLAWILATLALMTACIALPRALLPIHASMQFIDPIHRPETLSLLYSAPLDPGRITNLLYSIAAYWLPSLMLVTRARLRWLADELRDEGMLLGSCVALVLLFAIYGGTNLNLFVSYTLPVQVIVLAKLGQRDVAWFEWTLVLFALFAFSRIAFPIPSPLEGAEAFDRYVDFYSGWSSRVTGRTALRALEIISCIGLANLARHLLADGAPGAGDRASAQPGAARGLGG